MVMQLAESDTTSLVLNMHPAREAKSAKKPATQKIPIPPEAVDALLEEHWGLATALAREYSNIPGVAFEDILQHARIALMRAAINFRKDLGVAFSTYAWRVIQNDLNTLYTRQKRRLQHELPAEDAPSTSSGEGTRLPHEAPDENADVLREVDRHELLLALGKTIENLPPKLHSVILGILRGEDYRQIGKRLGFSEVSSKTLVSRAFHEALRQMRADLHVRGFRSGINTLRASHLMACARSSIASLRE